MGKSDTGLSLGFVKMPRGRLHRAQAPSREDTRAPFPSPGVGSSAEAGDGDRVLVLPVNASPRKGGHGEHVAAVRNHRSDPSARGFVTYPRVHAKPAAAGAGRAQRRRRQREGGVSYRLAIYSYSPLRMSSINIKKIIIYKSMFFPHFSLQW